MRPLLWAVAITIVGVVPANAQVPADARSEARELLEITHAHGAVTQAESAYVAHTIALDTRWVPYEDILKSWADEVFDWGKIEPLLEERLTKELSEAELTELLRFYRTPVGRKWVVIRPHLTQDMSTLMFTAQQEYRPQLRQRVQERSAQLQKAIPKLD